MWNLGKGMVMAILSAILSYGLVGQSAYGDDCEPVKSLVDQYSNAHDDNKRKEVFKKLSQTEPKTHDDMDQLRKIFSSTWDERIYGTAVGAIERVRDESLDDDLIQILKDEKPLMDKVTTKDFAGKTEKELAQRSSNIVLIIQKLGLHKNQKAVSILKEYLKLQGLQFYASEALGKIGDKTASEEIRNRAYKGEQVNYGGLGLDEASTLIRYKKQNRYPSIFW